MIYEVKVKEFTTAKMVWISDTSYHYFFFFIRQYNSHFNHKILLTNFTFEFPQQVFLSFKKLRIKQRHMRTKQKNWVQEFRIWL